MEDLQEKLLKLLKQKKSKQFYAEKLGISEDEVEDLKGKIRGTDESIEEDSFKYSALKNEITVSKTWDEKPTIDEVIKYHGIDTKSWSLTEIQTKQLVKGINTTATFTGKTIDDNFSSELEKMLDKFSGKIEPISKDSIIINPNFDNPSSVLLCMADYHLDKRTIDGKNIDEKCELFEKTIDNLIRKCYSSHNIEEIIYVTSNDFLHTDNYQEGTTKGTPQQSSVNWFTAYEKGFNLQAKVISKLRQFCKRLKVIHIPSNHSKTKEYYMVHALSVMFNSDPDIIFDRSAEPTKVHTYGVNFIGFHHGDLKDYNQVPQYFASKYRKEWGSSLYSEIALADKHHRKEWKQQLTRNELNGTRMFICPSMSGEDIWHKDNLFDLAIKASIARVYDKEKGFCTEFEERV